MQRSCAHRPAQVPCVQVDQDGIEESPRAVVGVRKLGQQLELPIRPGAGLVEFSCSPGGVGERLQPERAELDVTEALGDLVQRVR